MLRRLTTLGLLIFALLAGACAPEMVIQAVKFEEDSSGTFSAVLGFTPSDYAYMQGSYESDPAPYIASTWADAYHMEDYVYDSFMRDGYSWVSVTTTFDNPGEYHAFFNLYDLGLDPEIYPLTYTGEQRDLFVKYYIHEGTFYSGQSGGLDADWKDVRWTHSVQLPGTIVETDGQVADDGQTVFWNLSYYDHTTYYLRNEVRQVNEIALEHRITVSEGLSGTYSLAVGFQPNEYAEMQTELGSDGTPEGIAARLAERLNWQDYTAQTMEDNKAVWVTLTAPFADVAALQSLYGASSGITLTQEENKYRLTASPLELFEDEVAVTPSYIVYLPGDVTTTNGTERDGGAAWGSATALMQLESEVATPNPLALLGPIVMVAGLGVVGLTGVGVVVGGVLLVTRRRRPERPAFPPPPDNKELPS